jgi:hypothetical protein
MAARFNEPKALKPKTLHEMSLFNVCIAGVYMRERHALLQDIPEVITYKREVYSKWIILLIEVGYIPLAGFLSYVEWRLMRIYQTKFHPWINILVGK